MPITSQPSNPFNNVSPNMLTESNFRDPFEIAQLMQDKAGLPTEVLDEVHEHCNELMKDSWLGFIDAFQMNVAFETDYVNFTETQLPDYVIDDDGAVTRAGNVFTIDPTAIEGYEVGEDYFFFRENFVVMVVDSNGLKEMGVITAIDKANNTFTAVSRNGANWTGETTNLSIDAEAGGDFDKGSCGPEGLLELRKKKSRVLKLVTIKDAIKATGGTRYAYCVNGDLSNPEYAWYDENLMHLRKRLNKKIAKQLMNDIESVDASGAYLAGKYGTMGLFQNIEENGLTHTGYIQTLADLEAITTYWDSLGYNGDKEFICHCDTPQYRYLEKLAVAYVKDLGIDVRINADFNGFDLTKVGFSSIQKDGYVIYFSKWGLTDGNSPLGKNRIKDAMPKGIIMPMGTVPTTINGVERKVPYIFKAYQDKAKMGKGGMIRTYMTGGFNGDGDCEYAGTSKSTTVGLAVICPEAVTIIK